MPAPSYQHLNGIKTYAFISRSEIINYIKDKSVILVAVNAEKILNADTSLKAIINKNIGYTDGIGAVWALKKHGLKNTTKIPGCELWLDIIHELYRTKTFYFVGARAEVIGETVRKLKANFPGIRILNYRDGYLKSEKEREELLDDIKIKKPDVVFVATGSPQQELLMDSMSDIHPALYMGLGGSFDVYVDNVKRAPEIFRKLNLEWFYRLIKQPLRIKRQLIYFKFMWMLHFKRI